MQPLDSWHFIAPLIFLTRCVVGRKVALVRNLEISDRLEGISEYETEKCAR